MVYDKPKERGVWRGWYVKLTYNYEPEESLLHVRTTVDIGFSQRPGDEVSDKGLYNVLTI